MKCLVGMTQDEFARRLGDYAPSAELIALSDLFDGELRDIPLERLFVNEPAMQRALYDLRDRLDDLEVQFESWLRYGEYPPPEWEREEWGEEWEWGG